MLIVTMDLKANSSGVQNFSENSLVNGHRSIINMTFIIYCTLIVIGFVSNAVVMVTYCRKLRKSTYIFVFCLAVCDEINVLNILLEQLLHHDVFSGTSTHTLCRIQSLIADAGCLVSANLVVCIAFDRYLLSRYKTMSLPRRSCFCLVTGIVVCSAVVTLPFLVASASNNIHNDGEYEQHFCGREYYRKSSENDKIGLNKTSYFMISHNGVILTGLIAAFITKVILYVKMSRQLNKMSSARRIHLLTSSRRTEMANCSDNDYTEVKKLENKLDNSSQTLYDSNGNIENKQYTRVMNSVARRKSSAVTIGPKSVTRTKKYIILIISAIILFTFYLSHFILHIINIYHTNVDNVYSSNSDYLHTFIDILGHSYILCFILNPFIYGFFNRRFFKHFKQTFCCVNKRTNNDTLMVHEPKRLSQGSTFSNCFI